MSSALYRSMFKWQMKAMLSYGCGIMLYQWLFIWTYPSIAKSSALNALLKTMPAGFLKVIGYEAGVSQVGDYLAGEFYGLIYVIIMAIYAVMTATQLMARLQDSGFLAYLLATPVSRVRIAVSQLAVLVSGIVGIGLLCTVSGLLGVHWFISDSPLNTAKFVEMNAIGVLLFLLVGAYSFFFSCTARDERTALSASALLTVVFYALHTAGSLSDTVGWLRNVSIFTAFDPQALMHGTANVPSLALGLGVAAVGIFAAAVAGFRRKEMAL
ncbi:ABC transporter permease [Alicyclobacillus contaminans]|uniref:ABC transporter permease subunit n=1 Tax=Alicyclobacillus contaminans TaxID=392016 RepID=UPI000401EE9C|nr:ABC transporter permease subunit [Alicyclobacillus contaminans]GMA51151.1 ABC transporter permease [Alicyclobacillus contaminans]